MILVSDELLEKHKTGISAALNYYVYGLPTGLSDEYYDKLERLAMEDGLSLRDYACQFIQGQRSQNADYITKVEKLQVTGNMLEAMVSYQKEHPEIDHWLPKMDGNSLGIYFDPSTGKCQRVVTIGGSNLGSTGIDQSEKLVKYIPDLPGTGIIALQAECLVPLEKGYGEASRQKANGLINSSYRPLERTEFKGGTGSDKEYSKYLDSFYENFLKVKEEIDDLLTIRVFRYYIDPTHPNAQEIIKAGHKCVLDSLPVVRNSKGDIKFCGAYSFSLDDAGDFVNHDIWKTDTGTFLVDGVVGYTGEGICVRALKYKDSGRGEASTVLGILWNDQTKKGKDSFSGNALITPVKVRGVEIKKPTIGSVKKMVESGLSVGAKVTVILANSTIPAISKVLQPGGGDYSWPVCGCGHQLGPGDIFGSLLKCGNPMCTERESRMRKYLQGCGGRIDLNSFLVIDRFDWGKKADLGKLLPELITITREDQGLPRFKECLGYYLTTDLQRRNLELVSYPAYKTLQEYVRANNL